MALLSLGFLQALLYVLDRFSYGTFMFVFSTALLLSMLLFNPGIVPITRIAANSSDGDRCGGMVADLLAAVTVPAALICAGAAAAVFAASAALPADDLAWAVAGAAGVAVSTGVITLSAAFAQGRRRQLLNVSLHNGLIALRTVSILAILLAGAASMTGVLAATAMASFAMLAIALVAIRARQAWTPPRTAIAVLGDQGVFRQYRQNWPLLAGAALLQHGDKVILGFILPLDVLGLLALYQQIARVLVNTTIGAIQQYLAPSLLSQTADAGRIIKASLVSMACLAPVAGLIAAVIPWAGTALLHGVYDLSAWPFLAICLTYALLRASQINELAFFRADRVRTLWLPIFGGIAAFVIAAPVLGALFGLWGAIAGLLGAAVLRYAAVLRSLRRL